MPITYLYMLNLASIVIYDLHVRYGVSNIYYVCKYLYTAPPPPLEMHSWLDDLNI